MGDVEDDIEDVKFEEEDEYEYPVDIIKSFLKLKAISAARQAYCYCSVLIFPVFSLIYEYMDVAVPYGHLSIDEMDKKLATHFAITSLAGLIVGAIFLHFIGRKFTVIAVNVSYFFLLSYSYCSLLKILSSYEVTMMYYFITNVGDITFWIYLSEITSPEFRAFFMGLYSVAEIFLHSEFKTAKNEGNWNNLLRDCSVVAAFSILLSMFSLETPFWLTLKGNPEKAEETFIWLRVTSTYSDSSEFDQMLAKAENINENNILKHIFTPTFVIGVISSYFLIVNAFNPCTLMEAVLYDFYMPRGRNLTKQENKESSSIINQPKLYRYAHLIYGQLIFLLFNFVTPRKILYFVSYISGILIVVPIALRIGSVEMLKMFSSCCNLTPLIGITSLSYILPIEIYPIALREVGVVVTGVFILLHKFWDSYFYIIYKEAEYLNLITIYPRVFISLIGVPFILYFMPETKDMNIYELDELKLTLPFRSRKKSSAETDDDSVIEDESTADVFD